MQFEISSNSEHQKWLTVGNWFNDLVQFGVNLARFSRLQSLHLERILILAPRKEYVSLAIALGFSINKLSNKYFFGERIQTSDIDKLPIDSTVRIYFTSGNFINAQLKSFDYRRREISFHTGERLRRNYIDKGIVSIWSLPQGYPLGSHSYSMKPEGDHKKLSQQELWRLQVSPGVLVLTDQNNFGLHLTGLLRHKSFSQITGDLPMSTGDAARIASLLEHNKSSFINAYAGVSEINKICDQKRELFELFDWIILDGNHSTNRLAAKEELIERKVLSVMEAGVPRYQNRALESFMSELNRFKSIDICRVLNWVPPAGIHIWGWAR